MRRVCWKVRRERGTRGRVVMGISEVVDIMNWVDEYDSYSNWNTEESKDNHAGREKICPEATQTVIRI